MNPVITVLCTAAICLSMEKRWDWVGPVLFVAFCWALFHNYTVNKSAEKILKR